MNVFIDWDEIDQFCACVGVDANGEVWAYDDLDLQLSNNGEFYVNPDGNLNQYMFTIKDYVGPPFVLRPEEQLPQMDSVERNVCSTQDKASFKQRLINLLDEYESEHGVALTNIDIDRIGLMGGQCPITGIEVNGVLTGGVS